MGTSLKAHRVLLTRHSLIAGAGGHPGLYNRVPASADACDAVANLLSNIEWTTALQWRGARQLQLGCRSVSKEQVCVFVQVCLTRPAEIRADFFLHGLTSCS